MSDYREQIGHEDPKPETPMTSRIREESTLQEKQIKQNAGASVGVDPQRKAQAFKLSQEMRLPVEFVEQNFDQFKSNQQRMKLDARKVVAEAPTTARWLTDKNNMDLAKDDIPKLTEVEKRAQVFAPKKARTTPFYKDYYNAARGGGYQLQQALYMFGAAKGMVDKNEAAQGISILSELIQEQHAKRPSYVKDLDATYEKEGKDINQAVKVFQAGLDQFKKDKFLNAYTNLVAGGSEVLVESLDLIFDAIVDHPKAIGYITAESFANSFPSLALGLGAGAVGTATPVPFAGPIGFAGGTFGGSYITEVGFSIIDDLNKRGININDPDAMTEAMNNPEIMREIEDRAHRKGITTGAIDAAFSFLSARMFMKAPTTLATRTVTQTAKSAVKRAGQVAGKAGIEAVGEGVGEVGGQIAREQGLEGVDVSEGVLETLAGGFQGGVTAVGGEAVLSASEQKLKKQAAEIRSEFNDDPMIATEEVVKKSVQSKTALDKADTIAEAEQQIQDLGPMNEVPEKVDEVLNEVTGGQEADAVYFQTDDWDNFWAKLGISPVEAADKLLQDKGAYHEAKSNGSPIQVPAGKFIAESARDAQISQLKEIARFEVDGPTVAEADAHLGNIETVMTVLAEEAIAQDQAQTEFNDEQYKELREIGGQLETQVKTSRPPVEAKAARLVFEASINSLAKRMGMTPKEFFAKFPLTVSDGGVKIGGEPEGQGDQEADGLRPGERRLYQQKLEADNLVKPSVSELGFYSQLEAEVLKMDFKQVPPKDLKNRIANIQGLKKEEIEWTGINEFLDTYDQGKITKEQVVDYIKSNVVQVKQIVRGENVRGDAVSGGIEWSEEERLPLSETDPYGERVSEEAEYYYKEDDHFVKEWVKDNIDGFDDETKVILEEADGDFDAMPTTVQESIIRDAEARAEEYLDSDDNPYAEFKTEATEYPITITGNDENGYWYIDGWGELRDISESVEGSLDEAKIQAAQLMIESGALDTALAPIDEDELSWVEVKKIFVAPTAEEVDAAYKKNGAAKLEEKKEKYWADEDGKEMWTLEELEELARDDIERDLTVEYRTSKAEEIQYEYAVFHPSLQLRLRGSGADGFMLTIASEDENEILSEGQDQSKRVLGSTPEEAMKESLQLLKDYKLVKPKQPEIGDANINDPTKPAIHTNLTLEGGSNYREMLLTLPTVKGQFSVSSHFPEDKIVTFVRLKDRETADGKKVLFIEELQSDWHQQGKKRGYKRDLTEDELAEEKRLESEFESIGQEAEAFKEENLESLSKTQKIKDSFKSWRERKTADKEAAASKYSELEDEIVDIDEKIREDNKKLDEIRDKRDKESVKRGRASASLRGELQAKYLLLETSQARNVKNFILSSKSLSEFSERLLDTVNGDEDIYSTEKLEQMYNDKKLRSDAKKHKDASDKYDELDLAYTKLVEETHERHMAKRGLESSQSDHDDKSREAFNVLQNVNTEKKFLEFTGTWDEATYGEIIKKQEPIRARLTDINKLRDGVANAPFKQTEAWVKLALKRMTLLAAQDGYEYVSWSPGDVHKNRWSLAQVISSIQYREAEGGFDIQLFDRGERQIDEHSRIYKDEELEENFGTAVADQIRGGQGEVGSIRIPGDDDPDHGPMVQQVSVKTLTPEDFKKGGEWTNQQYDKMIPKAIREIIKKQDKSAKVQVVDTAEFFGEVLSDRDTTYDKAFVLKLTDKLKETANQGFTLFQSSKDQGGKQDPRGRITIGGPDGFKIELLKGADTSTFFHELGHYYLEVLGGLAETDGAPKQITDDFNEVLKWLGVESRDQITTEHHEMWARGFEAYLMEGKAPNLKMRKIFYRFKVWLLSIYKDIRGLDVELSEDVRNVMGRLLATEQEIAEANAHYGLEPLVAGQNVAALTDPQSFGMTGKAAERFTEAIEEARMAAEEQLQAELMDGYLRENEKFYKSERKRVRAEVEAEVNQRGLYKALAMLQRGKQADGTDLPEGTDPIKLNRQDLVNIYGADFVKALPKPHVYSREGGFHPDVVAGYYGFANGDELVQAIANMTPKKKVIEDETAQRMTELYPDIITDTEAMETKALEAIHNEKKSRLYKLMLDWLWQNRKGVAKDVFRRGIKGLPADKYLKERALGILSKKSLRSIKPYIFLNAQKKANAAAAKAATAGDFDTAYNELEKAALNHELMKASYDLQTKVKKDKDDFKKLFKSDEKLSKTRDLSHINAARAILQEYIFNKPGVSPMDYLKQMREYDPDAYLNAATQISGLADIQRQESYKDLTAEEFERIAETVKSLWDLSRESKTIEKDGKKVEIDDAVDLLLAQVEQSSKPKERRQYDEDSDKWDETKAGIMGTLALGKRLEHWVSGMDLGDPLGPFRSFIFEGVSEATDEFIKQKLAYKKQLEALFDSIKPTLTFDPIESRELGFKFHNKGQLLGALMHIGNESNKRKLLVGRGWGDINEDGTLNSKRWDDFIRRMYDEGVITKVDMDFVQGVWDLYEQMKPDAQKAHKKIFGYYFSEITANEFETPWGMYRGGYAPANIDPNPPKQGAGRAFNVADKQKLEELTNGHSSLNWPAAGGSGHTKNRVANFNYPLSLDLMAANRHLDQALRFSYIKPAVVDAAKIVTNERFRRAITDYDPVIINELVLPALSRADKNRIQTLEGQGASFIWKFANTIRKNVAMQLMFMNVKNIVEQTTGYFPAALRVKPKYLMDALAVYVAGPKSTVQSIAEKSKFMAGRFDAELFDIDNRMRDTLEPKSKFQKVQEFAYQHMYIGQSILQHQMDSTIWLGAYNEAIEQGFDEKRSIRIADSAIRETQGSLRPVDISRAESNPFMRIFQMFMSFFNNLANLNATEYKKLYYEDLGLKKKTGKGLYIYMMGFASIAIMSELVARGLGKGLDDEDDGYYADDAMEIIFGSQLRLLTGMVPLVGPAAQAGFNRANNKFFDDRVSASPALEAVSVAIGTPLKVGSKVIQGDDLKRKDVKDVFSAIGIGLGLPVGPASRPVIYLIDVESGKARPTGPIDFTRGLVTGNPGR